MITWLNAIYFATYASIFTKAFLNCPCDHRIAEKIGIVSQLFHSTLGYSSCHPLVFQAIFSYFICNRQLYQQNHPYIYQLLGTDYTEVSPAFVRSVFAIYIFFLYAGFMATPLVLHHLLLIMGNFRYYIESSLMMRVLLPFNIYFHQLF